MTTDNDGWIEWKGGEWVKGDIHYVRVKFRDGDETDQPDLPSSLSWAHRGSCADIIAYRIVNHHPTAPTYLMVIGNECWPFTSKEAVTEAAAKCPDAFVYEVGKPLRVRTIAVLE